jgi:hypothetical protein
MEKETILEKLLNIITKIIVPKNQSYLGFIYFVFIIFNFIILDNFLKTNFDNSTNWNEFIFFLFVCYLYYVVLHCQVEYDVAKAQNILRNNIYNGRDEGYNKWILEKEKKIEENKLKNIFEVNKMIREKWKCIINDPIKCEDFLVAKERIPIPMKWEDAMIECEKLGKGWRLPTIHELNLMYLNKDHIGNFNEDTYWSSWDVEFKGAPYRDCRAQAICFKSWSSIESPIHKSVELYVRAVRSL